MEYKSPIEKVKLIAKAFDDPIYFAEKVIGQSLFPWQKEILEGFYSKNYKKLVAVCGMRAGKSTLAAIIAAYEFFRLCVLKDPAKKYGLVSGEPLFIVIVATSTDVAEDAVYGKLCAMIESTSIFKEEFGVTITKDKIYNKENTAIIRVVSSWSTTAVGRTCKLVVFDELALFEESTSKRSAQDIWTRLSKSTATLGREGKIVAISSPRHPNDIIMTLYKQAIETEQDITLAIKKPTWELNPYLTKEQLMEEYKDNLAEFWRDFGVMPEASTILQFPEGFTSLYRGIQNLIKSDIVDHSQMRVMAIDPAIRNDAFGIAVGYLSNNGEIIIDGVMRIQAEDEPYISPTKIKKIVRDIVVRLNVYALVFDTWMFPELIEFCEKELGLIVEQHVVRKTDYDKLREMDQYGKIKICYDSILKKELESLLVINEKRVDHPRGGSKDVADCVANVVWYIQQHGDSVLKPSVYDIYAV